MSSPEKKPLKADLLKDLPPLTTTPLSTEEDIKEALHLITDSLAQQRQVASKSIIVSPAFLSTWVGIMAWLFHLKYRTLSDLGIIATTGSGITMALLLVVKYMCEGYVRHAESVASEGLLWFANQKKSEEDDILVLGTKYGDELIGTLVLRLPPAPAASKSSFEEEEEEKEEVPKVEIVAWTVKLKFRHKGIGRGLLEEAIRTASEHYKASFKFGFAKEHVHSKRVLIGAFNGMFTRREKLAAKMLKEVALEAARESAPDRE